MTARRPAPDQCANPLCGLMVYPDNLAALELAQVHRDPDRPRATIDVRWRLCGIDCARRFLALCELRHAAHEHPETSEAEA
jgi:hypothetical protein